MSTSSSVVSAPLGQLPESIQLGEGLSEAMSYDGQAKKLVYNGFMTRASYDYLRSLSNDRAYQDALLYIYIHSSHEQQKARHSDVTVFICVLFASTVVVLAAIMWWWRG